MIDTVEEFAKPYGGVAKIVKSKKFPYWENREYGKAGILMPITQVWRTPENVLSMHKEEGIAKADELSNTLLSFHLNALENADNDCRTKGIHENLANLLFDLRGRGTYLDCEGIPSALESPASARLFIDAARSEERFRYDADFVNGQRELDDQIAKSEGRNVN